MRHQVNANCRNVFSPRAFDAAGLPRYQTAIMTQQTTNSPTKYHFSFGPWNISEGADPFGPEVREAYPHEKKYALYKKLGFEGVQFHDDDVVPNIDSLSPQQIASKANEVKKVLEGEGLTPEFVAPR